MQNNDIYLGDVRDLIKELPDESVDLVVTDCPYRIIPKGGAGKTNKKPGGIFSLNNPYALSGTLFAHNDIDFEEWLPELYRALKQGGHCYIMINGRNLCELQTKAEQAGFKFQNLLVWEKQNATPNRYYMQQAEFILMLRKGKAKEINNMGTKNILKVNNIIGTKTHPTEKPVELLKILVENSSQSEELVLDPFIGTGRTAIACMQSGRQFIGFEIDEQYYKIAKERIKQSLKEGEQISLW